MVRHIFSTVTLSFTLSLCGGMAFSSSPRPCSDQYDPTQVEAFWAEATVADAEGCVFDGDLQGAMSTSESSPLHEAIIYSSSPDVLESLLRREGANPNLRLKTGETPLHYLADSQRTEADLGQVIDILVQNGALLDARDLGGMSLFLRSAAQGKTALLEVLLEKGAERSAKNLDGEGALALAVKNGHLDTVKALLAAGFDLENVPGSLALALQSPNPEVGLFVIENMEVIERRTNSTVTAAHIVARYGSAAAMQALKDRGARLSIGYQTERPIHWAAQHNQDPEIIKVILSEAGEHQASLTNRMGLAPIMLAIMLNPNPEVAQVLADMGADLSAKTKDGKALYDLLLERERDPQFKSLQSTQLYWDIHEARF